MLNKEATIRMGNSEILRVLTEQEAIMVKELVKASEDAICAGATKEMRGMPAYYIFWWVSNTVPLINSLASTSLIHNYNTYNHENSFLNPDFSIPKGNRSIPLYGGLTRALSHRISLHLKLAVDGRLESEFTNKKDKSPVYSYNQLRLGLEELFPNEKNSKQLIIDNVAITYLFAQNESEVLQNKNFVKTLHQEFKPLLNVTPVINKKEVKRDK